MPFGLLDIPQKAVICPKMDIYCSFFFVFFSLTTVTLIRNYQNSIDLMLRYIHKKNLIDLLSISVTLCCKNGVKKVVLIILWLFTAFKHNSIKTLCF